MKLLLCGSAALALCMGWGGAANAQVQVQESPVHAVPSDAGPGGDLAPGPIARPAAAEPAPQTEAEAASAFAAPAGPWVAPLADQLGRRAPAAEAAPGGAALSQDEAVFFSSLGRRITDSASAYETFVRKAGAIDPAFHDGAGVRAALRAGADYQPRQFQEGIVAFAALLALRDQAFVDAVRGQADPDFTDRLTADPQSVLAIPGAARAAADVTAVLRAQGAALEERGASITQAAYDVQAHPWSRQPVADAAQALAAEKAAAAAPHAASAESEKLLLHTVLTAPQGAPAGGQSGGGASPQVLRGLALAALAVRGRTGDREEARFQGLMHDEISAACLNMVKMNLDQCLAAAGPHYEHVFCVGRHAVGETAKCVSNAATGAGEPATPLLPRQLTASAERYGPEAAASYGYAAPRRDRDGAEADDRRRGDGAADGYGPDRPAGPPTDYSAAPARGYAHSYTPGPAYAQSGAAPRGYVEDRYQEPPADGRYAGQEQGRDPQAEPGQRYADSRQPW